MRRFRLAVPGRLLGALSLLLMVVVSTGGLWNVGTASASAVSPTVSGPVTGGGGLKTIGTTFDLAQVGYEASEYFVSGTATSYLPASPLTTDGKWSVTPVMQQPYKTRALVYRPTDAAKFNGTVVVEWLNVSGGADAAPDWTLTHNELVRDGFIWVGVSAQRIGVLADIGADPTRYKSLHYPDSDSFSYDIFSQGGQALRDNWALMLGGLKPTTVLAAGESQSASRLTTYIDAVHPVVNVYDGFLVHSRGAAGAALSQTPETPVPDPTPTMFRDDLNVPVFEFETETDVFNSTLYDRQPDTSRFRLWEIAGSSHFDYYGLAIGPTDTGNGQGAVLNLAAMQDPPTTPAPGFVCALPINTGGTHWILNDAIYSLNQWVVNGTQPAHAQRLGASSAPGSPVVFVRDANGNVVGGVRSPQVDAPIAALGGVGNSGAGPIGGFCRLFGTTVPFSASQLASQYPNHGQFVSQWGQAAQNDVKGGFLLQRDAVELKDSASGSRIGK
jgi:Alpha/beta hydrolase domain